MVKEFNIESQAKELREKCLNLISREKIAEFNDESKEIDNGEEKRKYKKIDNFYIAKYYSTYYIVNEKDIENDKAKSIIFMSTDSSQQKKIEYIRYFIPDKTGKYNFQLNNLNGPISTYCFRDGDLIDVETKKGDEYLVTIEKSKDIIEQEIAKMETKIEELREKKKLFSKLKDDDKGVLVDSLQLVNLCAEHVQQIKAAEKFNKIQVAKNR